MGGRKGGTVFVIMRIITVDFCSWYYDHNKNAWVHISCITYFILKSHRVKTNSLHRKVPHKKVDSKGEIQNYLSHYL